MTTTCALKIDQMLSLCVITISLGDDLLANERVSRLTNGVIRAVCGVELSLCRSRLEVHHCIHVPIGILPGLRLRSTP